MKPLPENILKRMTPSDRKFMGKAGVTSAESQERFNVANERQLQKLLSNELHRRGIVFGWSRSDKSTSYTAGWPDYTIIHNGRVLFWEVKFGAGKLSEDQILIHKKLALAGFTVEIVRKFDDAIESLKRILPTTGIHSETWGKMNL